MFHRGFRGSRRRGGPKVVQKTYKKVLNMAEASFAAGTNTEVLVEGKDSLAMGQTTASDPDVPTGAYVKFIEVQFPITNAVDQTAYINCCFQYTLSSQSITGPSSVGGAKQRNQVIHQDLWSVGFNQNSTHKFKIKIPKQFQRVKEGMKWNLVWDNSNTVNRRLQVIYKVYL